MLQQVSVSALSRGIRPEVDSRAFLNHYMPWLLYVDSVARPKADAPYKAV